MRAVELHFSKGTVNSLGPTGRDATPVRNRMLVRDMVEPQLEPNNPLLEQLRKAIAAKNYTLPSLPESAIKLRKALSDPMVQNSSVTKMLSSDPVLVGRLLQTANSPLFRGLSKISDLDMAVTRLGLSCIQNLVMSLTVSALFRDAGKKWMQDKLLEIWNNCIKIAALSEVIARRCDHLENSEALLIGLIHDIGSIPIIQMCSKQYGKPDNPTILDDAIVRLAPPLSSWILEHWELNERLTPVPSQLSDVMREHDEPADYADIIQVARLHVYRNKPHPLGKVPWHEVPAFKKLSLTPEASIEIIKEAREEIKAVIELLQ